MRSGEIVYGHNSPDIGIKRTFDHPHHCFFKIAIDVIHFHQPSGPESGINLLNSPCRVGESRIDDEIDFRPIGLRPEDGALARSPAAGREDDGISGRRHLHEQFGEETIDEILSDLIKHRPEPAAGAWVFPVGRPALEQVIGIQHHMSAAVASGVEHACGVGGEQGRKLLPGFNRIFRKR